MTEDQVARVVERRQRIRQLISKLQESLNLIKQLRTAIEKKHMSLDSRCRAVQSAATPQQIAKFLMWVNRNHNALAKLIPNFPMKSSVSASTAAAIDRTSFINPIGK